MSIATFTDMKGQVPFQDSSYTWTEAGFIAPGDVITMKYKFDAEPIFINGLFYFDILYNDQQNGGQWNHTSIYLRYADNRIYHGNNTEDFAIIDYNLQPNDLFYNPFGANYVVTAIDSITLENGERRKRIEVHCDGWDNTPIYWIEGIGSTAGLGLSNITCYSDIGGALLCVHKNDTLVYQNPEYNSCWITIVSSNEIRKDNLDIFPNPAFTEISINAKDHLIQKVSVIDLLGNIVFIEKKSKLDISFLPPGYYFLQIELENHQVVMKRFVKH